MRALRSLAPLGLLLVACAPSWEPPDVSQWTGEPQVAAKIRAAREEVVETPDAARSVGRLGMIFHAHELHDEAVACYRRAMALEPDEPRWPYLAALVTAKTDLEGSLAEFEAAVARGAEEAAVYISYGDALTRLGRTEQAVAQYRRALEIAPDSSHALYGLAQAALAGGDASSAASRLERAVAVAPHHGEAHALLAQAYRRLGRNEEAERALLRAGAFAEGSAAPDPVLAEVKAEAVSSRAFSDRGQRLARGGRFADAEADFRKVLEIRPGNARDYSNLGGALAGQGKLDEAIDAYRQALAVDPDDTYALNNLAMALVARGDPARAVAHLETAISIDPGYTDALRNLGLVHARLGRHEQAIALYRRALATNGALVQVHNDLGTSLAARGEVSEAMAHWRQALEIAPWELAPLYNLAIALVQGGEHREAIAWLRRGLETAPDSSHLVSLLAWELATAPDAGLRDASEAETLARRVYAVYPDRPQTGDVLAATLGAQGRYGDAVEIAEGALAKARAAGQSGLAAQIEQRLELYRRQRPFVQGPVRAGSNDQSG